MLTLLESRYTLKKQTVSLLHSVVFEKTVNMQSDFRNDFNVEFGNENSLQ